MDIVSKIGSTVRQAPDWAWAVAGAGALWWLCRPKPRHGATAPTPSGSEEIQIRTGPDTPAYNPVGAHAAGLPYELGHLCGVPAQPARAKHYPTNAGGIIAMLAHPDPEDVDQFPWGIYGGAG